MRKIFLLIAVVIGANCGYGQNKLTFTASDYIQALKSATDVMVNDVTSPVAASRYYAYINLATTEMASLFNKQQPSFAGTVNGLRQITLDKNLIKKSEPELAIS